MDESPDARSYSDAEEEIMRATYRALCEHGYADLTIKRIAEEYGKTTAAIHYHYNTKEDLLVAFLDYLLSQLVDAVHEVELTDPSDRLDLLLDQLLVEPAERWDFVVAMHEMRGQAPYHDAFRERFRQNEEYIRYMLETVLAQGIEQGVYDEDVDVEHATRALMTIVDGARTRAVVLDRDDALTEARETAAEYIDAVLLAND